MLFGILFACVLLSACDQQQPTETEPDRVEASASGAADRDGTESLSEPVDSDISRLLVLGDSLSAAYNMPVQQGWVALLRNRLTERGLGLDVINASISGDTTAGARVRLPALLDRYQPDLVMIELGGNDGLRGLAPEDMRENLSQMIDQSLDAGAEVILVGVLIPLNYGPQYRQAFERVYTDLAQQFDIELVPFPLEQIVTEPGYLQADGVHPTAEAQPLILDTFWPGIASAYREIENDS